MPVITIISVTYNCEQTIRATLESIRSAKTEHTEYIVIDGGSVDRTLDVIREYGSLIDKLVSEPDKGIYDAMNKGMDMASGQYIWFINAGDMINGNHIIADLENLISGENPDILYGDTMLVGENGRELGTRSKASSRKLPEQLNWKSLHRGMVVSHQSFVVKREIAPRFDLRYRSASDIDWVIRCLKNADSIVNTNMVLSRYLTGGYSKRTIRTSLGERFLILQHHYGFLPNLVNHLIITLRAIRFKASGKSIN